MTSTTGRHIFYSALILFFAHSVTKAQVAIRLPNKDTDVKGLIIVDTIRRNDASGNSGTYQPINSKEVWMGTDDGIYRIDEALQDHRIEHSLPNLWSLTTDYKYVWVSSEKGIFRISPENGHRDHIQMTPVLIRAATRGEGQTYLQTGSGIFVIADDEATPTRIKELPLNINSVASLNDRTFFANSNGLYEFKPDMISAELVTSYPINISHIVALNGRLWLNTDKGLMVFEQGKELIPISEAPRDIKSLSISNNVLLFWNHESIYTVDSGKENKNVNSTQVAATDYRLRRIADLKKIGLNANDIKSVRYDGDTILGSNSPGLSRFPRPNQSSTFMLSIGDIWLATSKGLYLYKNNTTTHRIPDVTLDIKSMEVTGSSLWLATNRGGYIIDPHVKIKFDIKSEESWWKGLTEVTWLLPNVRVSGMVRPELKYSKDVFNNFFSIPLERLPTDDMKAFVEMNREAFDRSQKNRANEYALPKNIGKELEVGTFRVYYSVQDQWGNTLTDSIEVIAIPGPFFLAALTGMLWALSLVFIIYLAPNNLICHQLLMNRRVRKWGYFNIVPIVITIIPPIRQHILQRYFNSIRVDKEFKNSVDTYVLPSDEFRPEHFFKVLEEHRKIYLLGQSGIGKTAYCKFLIGSYTGASFGWRFNHALPIFLPLVRCRGSQPEAMLQNQLYRYGLLDGEEIINGFLERGGFLFFFDGLNEIDDDTRNKVNTFIERYSNSNYFFLSSQEDFPEFLAERVQMKSLEKEKVEEILRKRLPQEQSEVAIESITDVAYEIYKIPQDLEMAIELLKSSSCEHLPQTRKLLYSKRLEPIFLSWKEHGQDSYEIIVIRRAYEMLESKESFFGTLAHPIGSEIVNDLEKAGFIDKKPDQSVFRHEQIHAFLASKYFAPRWRNLIKDVRIDHSWKSMLEFTFQDLEAVNDFRDLMFALTEKDYVVATDIFKWLKDTYPKQCRGWQNEFHQKLGAAIVQ